MTDFLPQEDGDWESESAAERASWRNYDDPYEYGGPIIWEKVNIRSIREEPPSHFEAKVKWLGSMAITGTEPLLVLVITIAAIIGSLLLWPVSPVASLIAMALSTLFGLLVLRLLWRRKGHDFYIDDPDA